MSIPNSIRQRVQSHFKHRCSYCLVSKTYIYAPLEIEHILPKSMGGSDEETNLCCACPNCNQHKYNRFQVIDPATQNRVEIFNPRSQQWIEHFEFGVDRAEIVGKTPCGRATVFNLKMNLPMSLNFRQWLVGLGVYPPKEL